MFSKDKKILLGLAVLAILCSPSAIYAAEAEIATVNPANLPISDANPIKESAPVENNGKVNALVSPSQAKSNTVAAEASPAVANKETSQSVSQTDNQLNKDTTAENTPTQEKDDFDFDLKMKSLNAPNPLPAPVAAPVEKKNIKEELVIKDEDLPTAIEYKTNPIENLGNNILSQIDSDLFTQMSEIEKSTTLLTLELRREKIRNEIEAQKAIRQKNQDDRERLKAEEQLKNLEKKKQIEAQVLREQQALKDKEQLLEVLKQRKLLNAYMNHMLVEHQKWLKEKEDLYAQLSAKEDEKKELVSLFKQKIDKLLEISTKNIQTAEAAKANFERIIKGLKARNEQLRKRIEADAKIIKNAQNSLYMKAQSLEELKEKNNAAAIQQATASINTQVEESLDIAETDDLNEEVEKLSSQFAILGISGRADTLNIEVIDVNGQPMSLKIGSSLPTGHVVTEIGPDFAKFSRNGLDEYLYIGKTIDGFIPSLGLNLEKDKK